MEKTIFKNHIGELIASVVLGFFELLALSLYSKDSLAFWSGSFGKILLFAGLWLVCSAVLFFFFRLVQFLFRPSFLFSEQTEKRSPLQRHPFLIPAVVLAVFYLPWIIAFYPGSAIYDMMYQTVQANGYIAMNAHHPIFVTWIIGLFSQLGLALTGGLNAGIFFYILFQSAVCILSFSYMISYLAKLGLRRGWLWFILGFFAVVPLWGGAMQCGTKDNLFTGLFVLFLVQSAKLLRGEGTSFRPVTWILYGALILLLCLCRNAIAVILLPTLLLFFLAVRKEKKTAGALAVCAVAALVLSMVFSTVTKNVYHTKTETGEILSLPFQQTARYVRDHPEDVTEEEQELIEKMFVLDDYRDLGDLYYPMSSDPVKARYHWWASEEEGELLKTYVSDWLQMLKRHPDTYLEAALAQTYGYYSITPVIKNQKGGAGTTVQFFPDQLAAQNAIAVSDGSLSEDLIPSAPESLSGFRNVLSGWYELWLKLPVLGLFFKCGFYFLILLAVTLYYGKRKQKGILLAVPGFLLILMAIASPVNEHIRYILPVVASIFLFPAVGAAGSRQKDDFSGNISADISEEKRYNS